MMDVHMRRYLADVRRRCPIVVNPKPDVWVPPLWVLRDAVRVVAPCVASGAAHVDLTFTSLLEERVNTKAAVVTDIAADPADGCIRIGVRVLDTPAGRFIRDVGVDRLYWYVAGFDFHITDFCVTASERGPHLANSFAHSLYFDPEEWARAGCYSD